MTQQTSLGMKTNLAASLCYALGWITGIFFLMVEKNNRFVRFHAWQSTMFFGLLTTLGIVAYFVTSVGFLGVLVALLAAPLWKVLSCLAYKGQTYSLPIIGKMAEHLAQPTAIASSGALIAGPDNEMHGKTA